MPSMTPDELRRALRTQYPDVPLSRVDAALALLDAQEPITVSAAFAEAATSLGPTRRKLAPRDTRSEAQIQHEIVMALKAAGWYVRRIGQRDARGTQDPGVPDLYVMRGTVLTASQSAGVSVWDARWGYHVSGGVWIECKTAIGRQSEAQREFQRQCEAAGVRYILAKSVDDITELL